LQVVVDRLLAHDDELGILVLNHLFQELGNRKRLDGCVGLDQDGAVCAHGERSPQRVL